MRPGARSVARLAFSAVSDDHPQPLAGGGVVHGPRFPAQSEPAIFVADPNLSNGVTTAGAGHKRSERNARLNEDLQLTGGSTLEQDMPMIEPAIEALRTSCRRAQCSRDNSKFACVAKRGVEQARSCLANDRLKGRTGRSAGNAPPTPLGRARVYAISNSTPKTCRPNWHAIPATTGQTSSLPGPVSGHRQPSDRNEAIG